MNNFEDIATFYDDRIRKYGENVRSVGWASQAQQELRFKILFEGLNLEKDSFLDLGSGLGDLLAYLAKNTSRPQSYLGIDASPKMVAAAKKRYSAIENVDFLVSKFEDFPLEVWDYIVMSGSFNLKQSSDDFQRLTNFLNRFLPSAKKGLLFNLLTTKVDYIKDYHSHFNPQHVLNLFNHDEFNVKLIENYGLYEFTIQAMRK